MFIIDRISPYRGSCLVQAPVNANMTMYVEQSC